MKEIKALNNQKEETTIKLQVSQTDAEIEMDKRTHLPLKVSFQCPNCSAMGEKDLEDQYLSYPLPELK